MGFSNKMQENANVPTEQSPDASRKTMSRSPAAEDRVHLLHGIHTLLTAIVVALGLTFLYFAGSFCITVILASFIAILVEPIIGYAERYKIRRTFSSALVIVVGMLLIGMAAYSTYSRLSELAETLPSYTLGLRHLLQPLSQKIERVQATAGTLTAPETSGKAVTEVKVRQSPVWPSYLIRGIGSISNILLVAGVLPFLVFFLLLGKDKAYRTLEISLGSRINVPQFVQRLTTMVRAFTLGNLLVGSLMSAVTVVVLLAIHLPAAVPLGILSGFLNLIPYLGFILAGAVPLVAGVTAFDTAGPYLIILTTVICLHLLSSNVLIPKMIGSRVNIGAVAATLGIMFWGWLWGAAGLFLAIPLTAFLKLIIDCYPSMVHVSNLMSETPRPVRSWKHLLTSNAPPLVPPPEPNQVVQS
jgi:AI-2 transport protein TqsA